MWDPKAPFPIVHTSRDLPDGVAILPGLIIHEIEGVVFKVTSVEIDAVNAVYVNVEFHEGLSDIDLEEAFHNLTRHSYRWHKLEAPPLPA